MQNGADDIKKHKWFTTGSEASYWEDMIAKKIPPPIKPDVGADNDTGNFEKYPDSQDGSSAAIDQRDQELFSDF